jgi:riboflavin biosynthesis pyrimidine reductase
VRTLLVHGDEKMVAAFLERQLVDYCVITLAACFLGGPTLGVTLGPALPEMRSCVFHSQGSDLIALGAMSYSGPPSPSAA